MKRVLILAYAPDALGARSTLPSECAIVSASPAISELLGEAGVPHTAVADYVADGWDAIHERIDRVWLREPGSTWRDDWSHLIVDTTRDDFFWSHVARRIVEVERPAVVLLQPPIESHPCGEALRAIASACELLGQHFEWWTAGRGG